MVIAVVIAVTVEVAAKMLPVRPMIGVVVEVNDWRRNDDARRRDDDRGGFAD